MFSTFTWWQFLLLIIFGTTAIVVATVVLISFVRKNKVGLSLGKGGLSLDPEDDHVVSPVNGAAENHRSCARWSDILLVIEYETEALTRIAHIQNIDVVKTQMNFADEQVSEMRGTIRKMFLKQLKEKTGSKIGLMATHEAQGFECILRVVSTEMADQFRFVFRENHLADKTEMEFESYLLGKTAHIFSHLVELLNQVYPPGSNPSSEQVYEGLQSIKVDMERGIQTTIRQGRVIALEKAKEVLEIRQGLQRRIEEISQKA